MRCGAASCRHSTSSARIPADRTKLAPRARGAEPGGVSRRAKHRAEQTTELADVVLPAASFAEKDGTFTNSERRVQRVHKAIDPPGAARADWAITCDLAQRLATKLGKQTDAFAYAHPGEIFAEMASSSPSSAA